MLDLMRLDDPEIEVRLRVHRRARRLTLRLVPGRAEAVLTLPPGVAAAEARAFVLRQAEWLRAAVGRQGAPVWVAEGSVLPVDGVPRRIERAPEPRRTPVLLTPDRVLLHGRGPAGPRLAAWLKARARDRMAPLAAAHAARLGVPLAGVAFKDTRSRWGSCSSAGRINLSWRLAMTPVEVQDYLVAHEVAHLVEMNHKPAYWAVLERLMPGFERPRAWLRANGAALHRYRFE